MRWPELRDWVYPYAEPLTAEEITGNKKREEEALQIASSHPKPTILFEAYEKLHDNETERLKSIETRLGGVLGLTSITSSLLVGGTFALVNGGLSDNSQVERGLADLCIFYLSSQIISSTLAAIRGLRRTTWLSPTINDLVPANDVAESDYDRERAKNACTRLLRAEENINYKVTQMAVAHTAVRNFAVGSAIIALLGFAAVIGQHPGSAAAKAIRSSPDLQKLLQGPTGQQGPPGPPGVPPAQVARPHVVVEKLPHRNTSPERSVGPPKSSAP